MTRPCFRAVTRTQGNNAALKAGAVTLPDCDLAFEEVPVLVQAFRAMVRGLSYDICEMALTTYLCARAQGVAFTAIPVFLVRDFHHGAMVWDTTAGMTRPKDLEGRRVGVNRGYTVTTGVWARAILQDEHDLDLARVTWAPSGDEHVEAYVPPPNVRPLDPGETLEGGLASGGLAAVVGAAVEAPGAAPIVPDAFAAGVRALKTRGLYPINHCVVVRDDVLAAHPDLAVQLFDAFAESKRRYVADLTAGRIAAPTRADRVHLAALEVMDDPLPYGVEPNRAVLDMLMGHVVAQGIVPEAMDWGALFAEGTRDVTG